MFLQEPDNLKNADLAYAFCNMKIIKYYKAWQFKRAHVHFLHNCRALGNCSLLNEITEGIDVWRKSRTETRSGVVLLWLLNQLPLSL
jgi:hypothetical protein